jgi:hypothetical protein
MIKESGAAAGTSVAMDDVLVVLVSIGLTIGLFIDE